MVLKQKANVWLAALKAVHGLHFGVKVLVASDVADALGLRFTFDENGFELRQNNLRGGYFPGALIAKTDANHTAFSWVRS